MMRLLANNAISMVIGDSGILQMGITGSYDFDRDRGVFIIFDPLTKTNVIEKVFTIEEYLDCNGTFSNYVDVQFSPSDTIGLTPKTYNWNLKVLKNIIYDDDNKIVGGEEVTSLFGFFGMPKLFLNP